jgi:hypothetical protein
MSMQYELQYCVVTIDITMFLFYFLGILEKVRPVLLEYCVGCCFCLILKCEMYILLHFSLFLKFDVRVTAHRR